MDRNASPTNPAKDRTVAHSVSDEIAWALHDAGIRIVFGQSCPTALLLACERIGIAQIGYRTENAGAAMADGFARASGQIACIGAQNGPAATLLVPGMAEALKASIPMLCLVQDIHRRQADKNAFQEFDHQALFSSCSVWFQRLTEPKRAYEFTRKAIIAATSGRPGPAVLMLPLDVLNQPVEPDAREADPLALGRFPLMRTRPAGADIDRAVDLLVKAERPIVVAGGGVHSSEAHEALARLRDALGMPVATTNMGKGAVDETHPLSVGVVGSTMGTRSPAAFMREYIAQADVVFFAGNRTNENGTAAWKLFPAEAAYIHADIDPYETQRNYRALPLVGDLRETLDALTDSFEARHEKKAATLAARGLRIADELAPLRERAAEQLRPFIAPGYAAAIRPERLVREIERHAPDNSIFVADASYSTLWLTQFLTCRKPGRRYLSPRGLAGLGWGYPMALGAKLAMPEQTVVALVGDGGFAHCWAELECAMRHGIDAKVVILNNAVLGFQRNAELGYYKTYTDVCRMLRIDHTLVARAVGCTAYSVPDDEGLEEALAAAFATPGPCLVDVIVDPEAFPPVTAFESQLVPGNG